MDKKALLAKQAELETQFEAVKAELVEHQNQAAEHNRQATEKNSEVIGLQGEYRALGKLIEELDAKENK